ncbi:hypothetical protein [Janthinobacterium sp. LB3P118]|uniref:hypothetical protein n=1 Tax=Janthinobacterium sp. LB3P118 TaxID=3424195 RepID=UPI003F26A19C
MRAEKQRAYVNGREAYKFAMPDKIVLERMFSLLGDWLNARSQAPVPFPAARVTAAAASGASPAPAAGDLSEVILASAALLHADKLYVAPHIPESKLAAAIASYGKGMRAEDVIVLIDDTLFGGAKEGIMISKDKLAMKVMMDTPRLFFWKHTESVAIQKRKLLVNGNEIAQLVQLGEKELGPFFARLSRSLPPDVPAIAAPAAAQQLAAPAPAHVAALQVPVESQLAVIPVRPVAPIAPIAPVTPVEARPAERAEADAPGAKDKLLDTVRRLIEQNKSKIIPLLKEKGGELSMTALNDDKNILKLSGILYALLPRVVQFVLSEQSFSKFLLENRDKLVVFLIAEPPAAAKDDGMRDMPAVQQAFLEKVQRELFDPAQQEADDAWFEELMLFVLVQHMELLNAHMGQLPESIRHGRSDMKIACLRLLTYVLCVTCMSKIPRPVFEMLGEDTYFQLLGIALLYLEESSTLLKEWEIDPIDIDADGDMIALIGGLFGKPEFMELGITLNKPKDELLVAMLAEDPFRLPRGFCQTLIRQAEPIHVAWLKRMRQIEALLPD